MAQVRLDQLNFVVGDVPATRAFYAKLGIEFEDAGDEVWNHHHISVRHDEAIPLDIDLDSATFAQKWCEGWEGGAGLVIGFKVGSREAVDETVGELVEAGGKVLQAPWDAFWGARYAVVRDPNGIALGIMSDIDPEAKYPAPDPV